MTNLDLLLLKGPPRGDISRGLDELRYNVLVNGIPANSDGMSELRIYIWLILLSSPPLKTDTYLDLVRQGPSPAYNKIRNDTFRTLATDPLFRRRVTENSLTRLLNAVAWRLHDAHEAKVNGWQSPPTMSTAGSIDGSLGNIKGGASPDARFRRDLSDMLNSPESDENYATPADPPSHPPRTSLSAHSVSGDTTASASGAASTIGYVQGMNVLAAPFLYAARSETQAFAAFSSLIATELPAYILPSMDGVHRGLRLVDEILAIVDPKLAAHLQGKGMSAEIYGFASVLTMCACTPPLPEVLSLWDFLFAYGTHLNLLCIVAQLVLIRDQIMDAASPNQVLRSFPPLQAAKVKAIAISFVPKIPDELYGRIVNHAR